MYSGKPIGSIGQPLIGSPLVAELVELLNERDRIMCAAGDRTHAFPKEMYLGIMQIQKMLHREVGRMPFAPASRD